MMKLWKTVKKWFLVLAISTLAVSFNVLSQSGGIVVDGADNMLEWTVRPSQPLSDLLSGVEKRFVVNHANTLRFIDLSPMPSALQAIVAQVGNRFVILWANTKYDFFLQPIPESLGTLLTGVQDRPIILWANTTHHITPAYPQNLIGDAQSPLITEIVATETTTGTTRIERFTEEFANSTVEYGIQPGQYTNLISDPLYTKHHRVPLSGLTDSTVYYFIVHSTDRSGNDATSTEMSFRTKFPLTFIYLPMVVR